MTRLGSVLTPGKVISLVFGLALLAAVLALGNPARTWRLMNQVGWPILLAIGALTAPYLAARALVWRRLLALTGLDLPWSQVLWAFAGGEFAKNLPGGLYLEDYFPLGRAKGPGAEGYDAIPMCVGRSTVRPGIPVKSSSL